MLSEVQFSMDYLPLVEGIIQLIDIVKDAIIAKNQKQSELFEPRLRLLDETKNFCKWKLQNDPIRKLLGVDSEEMQYTEKPYAFSLLFGKKIECEFNKLCENLDLYCVIAHDISVLVQDLEDGEKESYDNLIIEVQNYYSDPPRESHFDAYTIYVDKEENNVRTSCLSFKLLLNEYEEVQNICLNQLKSLTNKIIKRSPNY